MTFSTKQTDMEEFFQAIFVAPYDVVQRVFENMPAPSAELYDEFIRFAVLFGDSKRMQIGGGLYRYFGVCVAQIFQKEGVGVSRGATLADVISAAYRNAVADGVNYQVPYVTKVPFADKGWYQLQVTIPFYFDEATP